MTTEKKGVKAHADITHNMRARTFWDTSCHGKRDPAGCMMPDMACMII